VNGKAIDVDEKGNNGDKDKKNKCHKSEVKPLDSLLPSEGRERDPPSENGFNVKDPKCHRIN